MEQGDIRIERVVGANQGFGLRLLMGLFRKDRNIFFSPFSVGLVLSMAYNGAKEGTKEAMGKVLGVQDMGLEEVNRSNTFLMAALGKIEERVQFVTANGMWFQKGRVFEKEFLNVNERWYNATINDIDLQDPSCSAIINQWVRERTHGKIPSLVECLDEGAIMFIVNAVYFKGIWSKTFDPSLTREADFTTCNGSKKRLRMMVQKEEFYYQKGPDFQAIRLSYGYKGISMYIFLPDEDIGLEAFLQRLDPDTWNGWMGNFKKKEGTIGLPRFRVEFTGDLGMILRKMGMDVAFDAERANFKEISTGSPNVFIGGVVHRTFLEVTEQGTEAAAASALALKEEEPMPSAEEPFHMMVDRPFFCTIVHRDSGAILFMGSIVDPERVDLEDE